MYYQRVRAGCAAGAVVCAIALAALPGSRALAAAADIPRIVNQASPSEAPETVTPRELWRAGGEEDESIIFGVLTNVAVDDEGYAYLLDAQLHEVMVFTRDGEYLRSLGREGEGPGEFRRPSSMFITANGEIAVVQRAPGRIVLLTTSGEPAGNHALPEAPEGGTQFFFDVQRAGDGLAIDLRRIARRETGFDVTRELALIDRGGTANATLFSETSERNMANLKFDEKQIQTLMWMAAPDGRVFTSDNFDAYAITVWNADGTPHHVIERPYEHRKRTKAEMERNKPNIQIRGRGGQRPETETKASPTDRDIMDMYVRSDGTLWVVSSHGAYDVEDGTFATFDVYDRDGRYTRQVTVQAPGDYQEDAVAFAGDRMYILRGQRSARDAMFGGEDSDEEAEEEAQPMSVVCYDLSRIVQGRN